MFGPKAVGCRFQSSYASVVRVTQRKRIKEIIPEIILTYSIILSRTPSKIKQLFGIIREQGSRAVFMPIEIDGPIR